MKRQKRGCKPAPVVLWVHGGAWALGDKSNKVEEKVRLFREAGWVFVSTNYRLSPKRVARRAPGRIKHPTHVKDVAAAFGWVESKIAEYGGDPDRIALMGHSAGAHLVALASTDGRFLEDAGADLGQVSCTISLDTAGYDIVENLSGVAESSRKYKFYANAFGTDRQTWREASPITHVDAQSSVPDFLLAKRGGLTRGNILEAFAAKLRASPASVTVIDASGLTHKQVNVQIGAADDETMTEAVMRFLRGCFE